MTTVPSKSALTFTRSRAGPAGSVRRAQVREWQREWLIDGNELRRLETTMVHLALAECRRLAMLAADPSCGSAHRHGIADNLRQADAERQSDRTANSDELAEIVGMLLAMGEPL
ncbi:MAG TPA: hypothetical protein VFK02_04385 [Kofleriaceae bacterium]|nr:hypothetical protein [Kofleriaceae bacterium]